MMDRRRALMMANPWEEVPFDKTQFASDSYVTATYNAQTDTISLVGKRAGTYKSTNAPFFTEEGYEYLLVSTYNTTAGAAKMGIRDSNYHFLNSTSTVNAPASGNFRLIFPHSSNIVMISLLCSWSTSVIGNASYSGLRIYRRKAT